MQHTFYLWHISSLMCFPVFFISVIHPCSRSILICCISCIRICLIKFEPSSKCSFLDCNPLHNTMNVIICSKVHRMLALQMNRQSVNRGSFLMHDKFKHVPTAFNRPNISCIKVLFDFIPILIIPQLQSGPVMTFVDVLVDVLD